MLTIAAIESYKQAHGEEAEQRVTSKPMVKKKQSRRNKNLAERRYSLDQAARTLDQFIQYYGGERGKKLWRSSRVVDVFEELRIDKSDGNLYNRTSFLNAYGESVLGECFAWDQAERVRLIPEPTRTPSPSPAEDQYVPPYRDVRWLCKHSSKWWFSGTAWCRFANDSILEWAGDKDDLKVQPAYTSMPAAQLSCNTCYNDCRSRPSVCNRWPNESRARLLT